MHDAPEPAAAPAPGADGDAWAKACAEDLAAERARRRGTSAPATDLPAELRRLLGTLTEQAGRLGTLAGGAAAGLAAEGLAARASAAVEPLLDRHADVLDHLARAGEELTAAARAAFTPLQQPESGAEAGPTGEARDRRDDGGERDELR